MKQLTDEQVAAIMENAASYTSHKIEVLPYAEMAMRLVKIPDSVEVFVPKTPGSVYVDRDGTEVAVTATCRKLRTGCFHAPVDEHTHPDGDTETDKLLAIAAESAAWDISQQLESDVKHLQPGFTRVLWAPYFPPHLTPSFLDPKEFSVCHRAMYRYGKKELP